MSSCGLFPFWCIPHQQVKGRRAMPNWTTRNLSQEHYMYKKTMTWKLQGFKQRKNVKKYRKFQRPKLLFRGKKKENILLNHVLFSSIPSSVQELYSTSSSTMLPPIGASPAAAAAALDDSLCKHRNFSLEGTSWFRHIPEKPPRDTNMLRSRRSKICMGIHYDGGYCLILFLD